VFDLCFTIHNLFNHWRVLYNVMLTTTVILLPSAFVLCNNTRQFGCLLTRLVTKTMATITPADKGVTVKFMEYNGGRLGGGGVNVLNYHLEEL